MNNENDKQKANSNHAAENKQTVVEGLVQHTTEPRTSEDKAAQARYRGEHNLGANEQACHPFSHVLGGKTKEAELVTGTVDANTRLQPGVDKMLINFSKEAPTHLRTEVNGAIMDQTISTLQANGEFKPAPVSSVMTRLDANLPMPMSDIIKPHDPSAKVSDFYSAKPLAGCDPYVH